LSVDGGLTDADRRAVEAQLGRPPRDALAVAHRCPCGNPDVVTTAPRLSDGTPFPTLYYLTCPRAGGEVATLEAEGLMRQLSQQLRDDAALAADYRLAHQAYLADRRRYGAVPEIEGVSAGGMPDRVKCLHVLVAHALAAGNGVNPLGDQALAMLPEWWAGGACVRVDEQHAPAGPAAQA
jgi:hypothetical protein